MKRFTLIVLIFTASFFTLHAQQTRTEGQIKVQNNIVKYINLFQLNEQQAEQFTETFRAYTKAMRDIRSEYFRERPAQNESLSDAEIEELILDNFAQSRAILDTRERYYKEFRKVLTPSQINTIFEDEKVRRSQGQRK